VVFVLGLPRSRGTERRSPQAEAESAAREQRRLAALVHPPPPPRTKWTRRVPPPVLTRHVSSLLAQVQEGQQGGNAKAAPPRRWPPPTRRTPRAPSRHCQLSSFKSGACQLSSFKSGALRALVRLGKCRPPRWDGVRGCARALARCARWSGLPVRFSHWVKRFAHKKDAAYKEAGKHLGYGTLC